MRMQGSMQKYVHFFSDIGGHKTKSWWAETQLLLAARLGGGGHRPESPRDRMSFPASMFPSALSR